MKKLAIITLVQGAGQPICSGPENVWCRFAGPGRGDCEHFVGLPGKSIPGQHDGLDDTVDVYGIPNGWCEYCWISHKLKLAEQEIIRLKQLLKKHGI